MEKNNINSCKLPDCYPVSYDSHAYTKRRISENFSLIDNPALNLRSIPGFKPCGHSGMLWDSSLNKCVRLADLDLPNLPTGRGLPTGGLRDLPDLPKNPAFAPIPPNDEKKLEPPRLGGDRDSYGCIGSAGYQWCATLNKCVRSWETPCTPSDTPVVSDISASETDSQVSSETNSQVSSETNSQVSSETNSQVSSVNKLTDLLSNKTFLMIGGAALIIIILMFYILLSDEGYNRYDD
jgi:hypothetical protein